MNDQKAKPKLNEKGITFFPIPEVSDVDIAFGAVEEKYFNRRDLPFIPEKYESEVSRLMFSGGKLPSFNEKVDSKLAFRFTQAMLSSFAPSHESKIATVAYAFWVWTEGEI